MNRHRLPLLLTLLALAASGGSEPVDEAAQATLTKLGEEAPLFEVTTLDGRKFSLREQRGKVVLVSFFATWCGPCLEELPHLEKEIWLAHKDRKFSLIALGREHTDTELAAFRRKHKLTLPMAADPKRSVFGRYATAYIPRAVLIDPQGRIIDQTTNWDEARFDALRKRLVAELAKLESTTATRTQP